MTFQLDTTGFVSLNLDGKVDADRMNETAWTFSDLDPFTQGYVEALFETFSTEFVAKYGRSADPSEQEVRFSDLAPETLAQIIADCASCLQTFPQVKETDVSRSRLAGGYFWTNRQGGDFPRFPPLTVQLGDDGKVRFA